jgi:hypothetical protein
MKGIGIKNDQLKFDSIRDKCKALETYFKIR